ncbi:MAG: enoyl-CoA hydratase/isomerase family protein [Actinobacteria bacterium]|nr:enoyl-CoA hydratase/isomerase family protein [Actinomycetota bacterium]
MTEYGEQDRVRIERVGDVVHVTLCNPDARNAQTPATWRRLASIPELLTDDVRAVVLTGEGASFSAGLDRRMLTPDGVPGEESLLSLATYPPEQMDAFIQAAQAAFTWWRRVPQITIALVQGHAIGAGFQLALACDLMVVAPDAKLAMRETSLGLVPDLGGTGPLVSVVGYSRALEICATGRYVEAAEAVSSGIAIAEVATEQWDAYIARLLKPIIAAMPGAVTELKSLLQGASTSPDQTGRERAAQIRRLSELATLLGGGA